MEEFINGRVTLKIMISVTDLTGYMYCPRKVYFRKILGVKEKVKVEGLQGRIKHQVFDLAGKQDKNLICSLKEGEKLEDFQMKYRGIYYSVLMDFIGLNKKDIEEQGLKMNELFNEIWPFFLEEAKNRSKEYYDLAIEKKLYGEDLWLALPKGISELKIVSEKLDLIGVVDRVENFVPIEIKTGKAPKDGVWKENLIQLGAYMLLLSEHYGCEVNEGYVEYRVLNERRKVVMNPFLKDEIFEMIVRVKEMLSSKEKPLRVNEEWKCKMCGIREECFR